MSLSKRATDIHAMGNDYKRASYAISVRRYDLAIEILERVLSFQPENSMALYTLARAYTLKKQYSRALEIIKDALRLDATNSFAHTLYGSLLLFIGKEQYAQAEEEMLAAIRLDPSISYHYYIYAQFLLDQKKDIARAREHCYEALNLKPSYADYHCLLGRIWAAEGNIEQAEAEFLSGLSLDPENPSIHDSYGVLLFNQKRLPGEAYEHFRIALMQKPDVPGYRKNLLLALKTKSRFYQLKRYLRRRLGKKYSRIILLVFFAISLLLDICRYLPRLFPFSFVLCCVLLLFNAYLLTVDPILNFLIRRGWLR